MFDEMRFVNKAAVAAALMVVLATAPAAWAGGDVDRATKDLGWGVATVFANVFYVPAKMAYAVVGGVTGSVAFALTGGNQAAAERIWIPSIGGDYVLTADMVAGRQKIYFSGVTDPAG